MLCQLIAHPINGRVTKSTARPSSLGQVWLISVLTTGLIPTGCGPLPGVIQKSFTPWLGVYRLTVFVRGFETFLPPSLLAFSLSPFFSSFVNLSTQFFIVTQSLNDSFIKAYVDPLILLLKPGIVNDIMRII